MPIELVEATTSLPADAPLWRYVDVFKLLHLLTSRQLTFPASYLLGDEHEGAPSESAMLARLEGAVLGHLRNSKDFAGGISAAGAELQLRQRTSEVLRQMHFGSCWDRSSGERMSMWHLYGKGAAIQTTAGRLFRSFIGATPKIFAGAVRYDGNAADDGSLQRFFTKRPAFEDENEFRLLIRWSDPETEAWRKARKLDYDEPTMRLAGTLLERLPAHHLHLDVCVECLIEKLVVSPRVAGDFQHALRATIERLGYGFPVVPSEVTSPPKHAYAIHASLVPPPQAPG